MASIPALLANGCALATAPFPDLISFFEEYENALLVTRVLIQEANKMMSKIQLRMGQR
jgi:hypothetical protein